MCVLCIVWSVAGLAGPSSSPPTVLVLTPPPLSYSCLYPRPCSSLNLAGCGLVCRFVNMGLVKLLGGNLPCIKTNFETCFNCTCIVHLVCHYVKADAEMPSLLPRAKLL